MRTPNALAEPSSAGGTVASQSGAASVNMLGAEPGVSAALSGWIPTLSRGSDWERGDFGGGEPPGTVGSDMYPCPHTASALTAGSVPSAEVAASGGRAGTAAGSEGPAVAAGPGGARAGVVGLAPGGGGWAGGPAFR